MQEEAGKTYWKYKFVWRNVPCEARDGCVFINNRRVEELTNVNHSSQVGDLFFVDGRDVTDICVRYLPKPDSGKPYTEKGEIGLLKEGRVTITEEGLAGGRRIAASGSQNTDLKTEEKEESKKNIFGLRPGKGRSSVRQDKTA